MTVLLVFLSGKSPKLGLVSFGREMEGLTGSVVDDSIGTFLLNSRSMLRLIRLKYATDIETDLLFVASWSHAYCLPVLLLDASQATAEDVMTLAFQGRSLG